MISKLGVSHEIIRRSRSTDILCQGRGSNKSLEAGQLGQQVSTQPERSVLIFLYEATPMEDGDVRGQAVSWKCFLRARLQDPLAG